MFFKFYLFSVSNRFVCYFRLLKFTLRKSRLNIVNASDSIRQERLPISLEVGSILLIIRAIYKGVRCEKKQTNCKSSQDRYKIPSGLNNLFRDQRIIYLRPADYMQRNLLLIKVHV